MKKVFIWLKTNILKHKKRLIYGALALFIGQICFFNLGGLGVNNSVYAQTPNTPTQNADFQNKTSRMVQKLSFFQRALYILLYPILALAGVLVNNSFVYAEVFKFDVVLRQFWNVVRNIANYTLGFIFVFKIFRFLTHGQKMGEIKTLLTSTLIAGIGIQASWFLLAVLIDISNIVAYGVGGLPIKMLGQQSEFGNPYVMKTAVYTDLEDPESMFFYLSNTSTGDVTRDSKYFIAECKTFSYFYDSYVKELIIAPKIVYYHDTEKGYKQTLSDKCHIGDDVYYLNGFVDGISWQSASDGKRKDAQNVYMDSLDSTINKLKSESVSVIKKFVSDGKLLEIGNAHGTGSNFWVYYDDGQQYGLDVDNNWSGTGGKLEKLRDVLNSDYLGVFSALYGSLLNASTDLRVTKGSDVGIYAALLNVVLSFGYVVAIGIPLIAMVVVFFMRIGVIWMAIILSPIIILLKAFNFEKWATDHIKAYKYLTVENLIGIIFSPAVVCFAVSISAVLVRIISVVNIQEVFTEEQPILGGIIKLDIAGLGLDIGKLISSVIGIAISWFLVWTAVKMSALGESSIIKSIETFAKTALGSVPVVPIPGKDGVSFVGVDAVKKIPSQIESQIKSTYGKESDEAVLDMIDPSRVDSRRADAYQKEIVNISPVSGTEWTSQGISIKTENGSYVQNFDTLLDKKKEDIIEAINGIQDATKRQAFGDSKPSITFNNGKDVVTYEFRNGKYEKQN